MDDRVSPISLERDIFYLNVLQESSLINRDHLKFIPQSPQKKDAPEHCSEWQATNIKSKILISISSEETYLNTKSALDKKSYNEFLSHRQNSSNDPLYITSTDIIRVIHLRTIDKIRVSLWPSLPIRIEKNLYFSLSPSIYLSLSKIE